MKRTVFCIILAATAVLMFLLNHLTPFAIDDFQLKYDWITGEPTTTIGDIWTSTIGDYLTHSGRFVAHFLYGVFAVFLQPDSKWVFNICNTLVFMLLIVGIYLHALGKFAINITLLLLIIALLLTSVEGFGNGILWMGGACNYLWPATFMLLFLLPYRLANNWSPNIIIVILYGLLGILVGDGMENLSMGVTLTLIAYLTYKHHKKEQIAKWELAGTIGLTIGTLILIAAPGNFVRFNDQCGENKSIVLMNAIALTKVYFNKNCLFLPLLLTSVFALTSKYKRRTLVFMLLCVFLATYAMMITNYFPPRTRVISVILSIIPCGYLFANITYERKIAANAIAAVLVAVIVFSSFDALRTCQEVRDYFNYVDNTIAAAKAKGKTSVKIRGYVGKNRFCIFDNCALYNTSPKAWTNMDLAKEKGIRELSVKSYDVLQWATPIEDSH